LSTTQVHRLGNRKILYNCHQYEVAQHKITKENTELLDAQANNLTPLIDENYHKIGSVTASLLCCLIHANEKWNNAWYKKMLKKGDVIPLDDGKMGQPYILSPTEEILSSLWNLFKTEYASITHEKMPEGTWIDQDKYYEMLSRLCEKKKRPVQAVPIGARTIKDKESLICAAKNNERETLTLPNQSSLAAIWELNGKRIFLTGDADPDILLDGLNTYSQEIVPFEVVKLPHHGSRNNLTTSLIDKMNTSHYMLTGGKSHEGPHWEALAKVITHTNVNGAHTLHISGSAGEELLHPVWEGALNDVLKEYQCFVNKHNEVSFEC
jgi:hypothetical protein